MAQPGETGEPELEEVRKSKSEIGNPESQNGEWDDYPGGAAAAESSTPDQRNEVQNRHIEANLQGTGILPVSSLTNRRRPQSWQLQTSRDKLRNPNTEPNLGDGHLARQQPDEPAAAAELSTPDQRDKLRNPNTEPNLGDGHLARQQPDEPAAAAESSTPDQRRGKLRNPNTEPNLGDGHLARQQPDEPAAAAELATPD